MVGPSGAGKSTLLALLLRFYDPTRGRVLVDDHDVRHLKLASLRVQIATVLQDTLLFATSVRDNIAYGAPGASIEEIEAAARLANADAFITALPDGYDTILGERGVTLSEGERQRIALARGAIGGASILVLDEPTTGLDEANAQAVMKALEQVAQGRVTLLITHELAHAVGCDEILWLEEGRILERGAHADLMRRDGR